MPNRTENIIKRSIAFGLIIAMLCLPANGVLMAASPSDSFPGSDQSDAATQVKTILLFPLANNAGAAATGIGSKIDDAVRLRLANVNRFRVTRYSKLLPPVQRGIADKDLTTDDVIPPFADDDKDKPRAAKIANRVGTESYFIGNVESYTADPATKKISLQITGSLYATETGNSIKSVGCAVEASPLTSADDIDTVIQYAVDNAASQIAAGINAVAAPTAPTVVRSSQRGKAGGASMLLVVLGGALLYAALHHGSSSSSSSSTTSGTSTGGTSTSGTTGPPAPPL